MTPFAVVMWIYVIGFMIAFILLWKAEMGFPDPRAAAWGVMDKLQRCLILALCWPLLLVAIKYVKFSNKEDADKDNE